ncbi:ISL3 family transposase [Dictyobacter kobayashii]|uniref:ISL3 family transposase n=2 Tax=Dictyobacter kobayashii TaxID=2014872 RepID=UPI000F833DCA|nr:ISL3 family transposase [Dictyobacter kobayashii]
MSNSDTISSPFFPLPDGISILGFEASDTGLVVSITCHLSFALCPGCQQRSERIHSSYRRLVADVPSSGRQVTLALTVRKFICGVPACSHKIFTERMPDFVRPYARLTNRLLQALQDVGVATCAEAGVRLAPKLGMSVTATTLLRRMRERSVPTPDAVRILGVDDWAWRKGMTYGSILVDLERRCPIEILPDRKAETVEAWLRLHPEIEVVSRDRAGAYAEAVRKGAPQALEVADRFHLLKNLREHLRDFLLRKHTLLPEAEEVVSDAIPQKARGRPKNASSVTPPADQEKPLFRKMSASLREYEDRTTSQTQVTLAQERKQASRARRYACYEAVRELHQQDFSGREIARRLQLSRHKVMQFIQAEGFPERVPSVPKPSILDPYKPLILERWAQGCHNGTQIYHEITLAGYTGSEPLLRLFITQLRKQQRQEQVCVPTSPALAACKELASCHKHKFRGNGISPGVYSHW